MSRLRPAEALARRVMAPAASRPEEPHASGFRQIKLGMNLRFTPLQIESGLARNMLHGDVVGEDGGDDAFELFVAPDLHQAAQQFAAEPVPLIRVADQNRELGP